MMASVIDLSSDDEDASETIPVTLAAAAHTTSSKKQSSSDLPNGAKVGIPPGGSQGADVRAGEEVRETQPKIVLNGVAKGSISPGGRKGKMEKNGDHVMEEVSLSSPRLSNWGDPLPPEPDLPSSAPDPTPREKGICSTSGQDKLVEESGGSNDVQKKERGANDVQNREQGAFAGKANKVSLASPTPVALPADSASGVCRHFWRAGDYDDSIPVGTKSRQAGAMDHVRVHPKFLHSNATSHKWALGALAELLDNAVDEVQNGATFVSVDKIVNPRDRSPALLVQDDGGGMTPDCMRQCMSLGYSRKNTNTTIGQYGNGFKTSTMRLGADVIVFSRCAKGSVVTQSIGLLSYTFLRKTGHEDVVVPMIDYEVSPKKSLQGEPPRKILRSTIEDWHSNLASVLQWSPYSSESELLAQFDDLGWHGTKVIVYNLWFNDDGVLELDFDTDEQDIQLRGGVKQDKGKPVQQQLSQQHIATRYHHSLRVYSSILYLQMPLGFQVILRGKPVEHHSIASDLKFPEQIIYKPQIGNNKEGTAKETSVITTIGFTKEAPFINVHGFNVYHKNRLIMPFWKVWQDNSSRGRGVVGVLEANFIEPAHDKQDFERTAVLLRLETRLKQMTVEYWNLHCHLIGYQPNTKAGKARKQAASSLEYPAPIASITPSIAPAKANGPSASAPSTPPQPAADVLKSPNGDLGGGQVKPEPVDLERPNSVSTGPESVERSKRQRTGSDTHVSVGKGQGAGGTATHGALAVQQTQNDAMMIDLVEENSRLRARVADCEHYVQKLGSKISTLEKELMVANTSKAKLQKELELAQRSQKKLKRLGDTTESEKQKTLANERETTEKSIPPKERLPFDRVENAPTLRPVKPEL